MENFDYNYQLKRYYFRYKQLHSYEEMCSNEKYELISTTLVNVATNFYFHKDTVSFIPVTIAKLLLKLTAIVPRERSNWPQNSPKLAEERAAP